MPRKLKKLTLNEISFVDVPAMEGAVLAIQKRYKAAGREEPKRVLLEKAEPELYKALDISAHLYVWDICCDWDVEWAISRLTEVADVDLPFIAKYIAHRANAIGCDDLLPTKGVFANLVKKAKCKGKPKKKEADMPETKSAEDLQKELDEAKAKIEALEKEAETNPAPEPTPEPKPEVYKAADGKEYTGDAAVLAKRIDEEQADRNLEKRAEEFKHIPGDVATRKNLLKAIDSLPTEEERTKALDNLRSQNAAFSKAFKSVGDVGGGEPTTEDENFNKAMEGKTHKDAMGEFIKSHGSYRPKNSAAIPAAH